MKAKSRQSGLTLTEMTVVIVTVALLTSFGLPAVRTLFNSMATSGGTRAMISAALASARAIAAKEQHYAGIRFQEDLYGRQYIIFIVQDPEIGAYFFRAVEGIQPIKLPDSVGVMDISSIVIDADIDNDVQELTNATTFSIVFSPSGKLVIHQVRVRNRDGEGDYVSYSNLSQDDIFNRKAKVENKIAMFYQDDYFGDNPYPNLGLGAESSRRSFIIYDKTQFDKIDTNRRWSDYLVRLVPEMIYINPYTGTMIKR